MKSSIFPDDIQVNHLDRQVLDDIRRMRVMTGLQLQLIHHGDDDAAKQRRVRQMARLSRLRLAYRMPRRVGGPGGGSFSSIYTLGAVGQQVADPERGRGRRPWTPSSNHLMHALTVSEIYTQLRLAERSFGFELVEFDAEPECWRIFTDIHGRVTLKPDAFTILGTTSDEFLWFVEVDRGTESAPRITDKCVLYRDFWRTGEEEAVHGASPKTLWCVPDRARADRVIAAIHELDVADHALFEVATFDQAPGVLAGLVEGMRP